MKSAQVENGSHTGIVAELAKISRKLCRYNPQRIEIADVLQILCTAVGADIAIMYLDSGQQWSTAESKYVDDEQIENALKNHLAIFSGSMVSHMGDSTDGVEAVVSSDGESCSYLSVPISSCGKVQGVLHVRSDKPEAFTSEDLDVLHITAFQLGPYLKNLASPNVPITSMKPFYGQDYCHHAILLDSLAESISVNLAYLDRDFNFIWVNSAYAEKSGYSREQMIGRNHFELFPNAENQAIFEKVREAGEPYEAIEKPFVFPNQPERGVTYWTWTLAPVKDKRESVIGLALSLCDVTDDVRTRQKISALQLDAERRAEELQASEERAVSVLESISDGFMALDSEWRFVYINQEAETLLGMSRTELLGKVIWEEFSETAKTDFFLAAKRVMDQRHPMTVESYSPVIQKWIESRIFPSVDGICIYFHDITDRIQAQEALRISEEINRAIISAIPDPIFHVNKEGVFLSTNRLYGSGFPIPAGEFLGKSICDALPEHLASLTTANIAKALRTRLVQTYDFIIELHGHECIYEARVIPVNSEEVLILLRDVTDLRKAIESLKESERLFRTIFESTQDAVVVVDDKGCIVDANEAASVVFGLSRSQLAGRSAGDFLPNLPDFKTVLTGLEESGRFKGEYQISDAQGVPRDIEYYVVTSILPGKHLGVLHDVTERKRAEEDQIRYMSGLDNLIRVTAEVLSETTEDGLARRIAEAARKLTGAKMAICGQVSADGGIKVGGISMAPGIISRMNCTEPKIPSSGVYREVISKGIAIRLTNSELQSHPARCGLPENHPKLRGLLAVPLVGEDGRPSGMIAVSDKEEGDFTAEDEALLSQLALLTSLGLRHIAARNDAEMRAQEAETGKTILDALMEHAPEGITIADAPDVRVRMVSRHGQELVGRPKEVLEGVAVDQHAQVWGMYNADGSSLAVNEELPLVRATLKGEVVRNEEWMLCRPDGKMITTLCNAGPIRDKHGKVIGGVCMWRDISTIRKAREILEIAYEREHRIADAFQKALIPKVDLDLEHLRIYGRYKAAFTEARVGGDFYDLFNLPDGKIALVMGDVSGKGLQAAVHTATAKYMLRAYAHEDPEPRRVIERLNRAMCQYTPETLFVTLIYGVLDPEKCSLLYANGGHDEPLHYIHRLKCAVPLDVTGRAVGIIPESVYSQRMLQLEPNDVLLIYTDGITDARSQSRFLGIEGLIDILVPNVDKDERRIAEVVFDEATNMAGGSLRDDAAVLVLKAKAGE